MKRISYFLFFIICFSLHASAQQLISQLREFSNDSLFDLRDTTCFSVSGEWTGEEIQYDPTKSFIKVKFKVVFKLQQQGNRVWGTSFIQDKYRGSHGDMKIRGMVVGNKLHFEEYELVDETFFEKGYVWCLRSGEMNIRTIGNTVFLDGLNYEGYRSDTYSNCTDYCEMSVSKAFQVNDRMADNGSASPEKMEVLVFPNPFTDKVTISYQLKENVSVRIDVFSLSGAHIRTVLNDQYQSGSQQLSFDLGGAAAGVYLVRLLAGSELRTKQIVKAQ